MLPRIPERDVVRQMKEEIQFFLQRSWATVLQSTFPQRRLTVWTRDLGFGSHAKVEATKANCRICWMWKLVNTVSASAHTFVAIRNILDQSRVRIRFCQFKKITGGSYWILFSYPQMVDGTCVGRAPDYPPISPTAFFIASRKCNDDHSVSLRHKTPAPSLWGLHLRLRWLHREWNSVWNVFEYDLNMFELLQDSSRHGLMPLLLGRKAVLDMLTFVQVGLRRHQRGYSWSMRWFPHLSHCHIHCSITEIFLGDSRLDSMIFLTSFFSPGSSRTLCITGRPDWSGDEGPSPFLCTLCTGSPWVANGHAPVTRGLVLLFYLWPVRHWFRDCKMSSWKQRWPQCEW